MKAVFPHHCQRPAGDDLVPSCGVAWHQHGLRRIDHHGVVTNDAERSEVNESRPAVARANANVLPCREAEFHGGVNGAELWVEGVDLNDTTEQSACKSNAFLQNCIGAVNADPCLGRGIRHPGQTMVAVDNAKAVVHGSDKANVVIPMACKVGHGTCPEPFETLKSGVFCEFPKGAVGRTNVRKIPGGAPNDGG